MHFSKPQHNYFTAVLGGLLWWAAWPTSPLTFLAFVAFVPLLFLAEAISSHRKFFGLAYVHMFIWNAATTWWIYNASFAGAVLAIVLNSLIMCVPWLLMRRIKNRFGVVAGLLSLIAFWISYEYIHHRWDLSWPWLTLGNVFARQPQWVQWYEVTGTTGGSLWILSSNIWAYHCIKIFRQHGNLKKLRAPIVAMLLLLSTPLLVSYFIGTERDALLQKPNAVRNVIVVQPNVDPYDEKFTAGTLAAQIQNLITLSEQQIDTLTALVVWPETAIPNLVNEDSISGDPSYEPVWQFLARHPQLSLLSGIEGYKTYGSERKTATARKDNETGTYYDVFNTAALLNSPTHVQFYHKAKLVPGVESLPWYLLWMTRLFEGFGGASGTYGHDNERVVFTDKQHYFLAAPIICYESIYSDYITGFVRKGANLLTIITNDGWWDNTQGHKQHMAYARLRAIETRRWIARSANTGISCFIDPLGTVHQPQPWDTKAAIKMNIEPLQRQTIFVRYGDYLSRIINVASVVFLLLLIIFKVRKKTFSKAHAQATEV